MQKAIKLLDKSVFYLTGVLFIILFLVNIVQIIFRATSGKSILWVVDFSQLTMIWIVFLGASVAVYRHEHLLIDFIKQKVSILSSHILDLITRSLFLVFMIVVVFTGVEIVKIRMNMSFISLGWPIGYAYVALPISGVIISIYLINFIIGTFKKIFKKENTKHKHTGELNNVK